MTGLPSIHTLRTVVFDCDGVLLNSNHIKTNAFRDIAGRFGEEAADALVRFHTENGGISRYRKFEYLLKEILGRAASSANVDALASDYGDLVFDQLLTCAVAPGLRELREATAYANWMIISGGAESELRKVFAIRGLDDLFDAGIHGSPATKEEILGRLSSSGHLRQPALFLGDSRYDHEVAARLGLDFVFVHGWTEFTAWRTYCEERAITSIEHVGLLAHSLELQRG